MTDMFTTTEQMLTFFEERKNIGIKLGLERIKLLLELLDNPQNKIKAIHVAGTNGKGSTIAYLKNALMYNGYKVGVYSSPSLDGITGHIFLNDHKITVEEFLRLFNILYPLIQQLDASGDHPTEYEILTALAFMFFSEHVDIALIETAMGGRFDTTNCFQPILSIITNIDKDHMGFLGQSIKEIAYHKAGIIKEQIPVIVGDVGEEASAVIREEAEVKKAKIYQLHEDFHYRSIMHNNDTQTFTWVDNDDQTMKVSIHMYGVHQVKNAALALMSIRLLMKLGYEIDREKVFIGLENTFVPGRFEVITKEPTIILDGAHNLAGMQTFLDTVTNRFQNKDKHLIFAGFKDKELQKMLQLLLDGYFSTITVTSFEHERAACAAYLYSLTDLKYVRQVEDWKEATSNIYKHSANENEAYFITGSLHFIAMVRNHLLK